jgi:hypothetical protein
VQYQLGDDLGVELEHEQSIGGVIADDGHDIVELNNAANLLVLAECPEGSNRLIITLDANYYILKHYNSVN